MGNLGLKGEGNQKFVFGQVEALQVQVDVCNKTAWQSLISACTVDRHIIYSLLICRAAVSEGALEALCACLRA